MTYIFKLRRDTELRWSQLNPILSEGEPGYETDTGKMKIGNGHTPWNDLGYFAEVDPGDLPSDSALLAHINAAEPHPAYDDGPDLFLLYENAKV